MKTKKMALGGGAFLPAPPAPNSNMQQIADKLRGLPTQTATPIKPGTLNKEGSMGQAIENQRKNAMLTDTQGRLPSKPMQGIPTQTTGAIPTGMGGALPIPPNMQPGNQMPNKPMGFIPAGMGGAFPVPPPPPNNAQQTPVNQLNGLSGMLRGLPTQTATPMPPGPMQNPPLETTSRMKKGGSVKVKTFAKGGTVSSASSRGDGIAQRGKTRGKIC
jgi:hypothetical protein